MGHNCNLPGNEARFRDPQQEFAPQIPLVTLILVTISAIVYLLPGIRALLEYDRAAISEGEIWRMITCHWVHFSSRHFIYDTAAFGIAGWMIERRGYRNFGWLCALAAVSISGTMLCCEPRLQVCGGLSGLATAAVVFLAVNGLEEKGAFRWICAAVLVLNGAKMGLELATGRFVFLQASDAFVPVPANHIAGAITAVGVYLWRRALELQPWRTKELC